MAPPFLPIFFFYQNYSEWSEKDFNYNFTTGVVNHVLICSHHYQNASIQDKQIQCRKYQM